jgi:hypothetical protein
MKKLHLVVLLLLCLSCSLVSSFADEQLFYRSPTMLANTRPEMQTPGFWISHHPSPDALIMDAESISQFNKNIRSKFKSVKDLSSLPENFSGDDLIEEVRSGFEEIKAKGYFFSNGEQASDLFFQDALSNLNLTSVPSLIEPEFGFVLRYTAQRFLPTIEALYEQPGDWDFDYLQNNALQLATPVAILHKSFDGQWLYVFGPTSDGWVQAKDIVVCTLKDIQDYLSANAWAVTVKAKADVFLDQKLARFDQYVQMGARFPKEKKQEAQGVVAIKVPSARNDGRFAFKTAYLEKDDVSNGYLPYTARTIYKQAFKLLNQPYGWGGMYGEQDCSRFLQEIFATVGIDLPRDSKDQAKVGLALATFDPITPSAAEAQKKGFFNKPVGGVPILTLKGHIMLYLGELENRPYAIHAVWAYREPLGDEDQVHVINRVVVSDLDLGDGSKKGSLFKRLTGVRAFSK